MNLQFWVSNGNLEWVLSFQDMTFWVWEFSREPKAQHNDCTINLLLLKSKLLQDLKVRECGFTYVRHPCRSDRAGVGKGSINTGVGKTCSLLFLFDFLF